MHANTISAVKLCIPRVCKRLPKVCMVCFDGTTDDNKNIQIVYCDGCGMSVHQHCYGVKDVEADFCCERCRELRNIEKETYVVAKVKNIFENISGMCCVHDTST